MPFVRGVTGETFAPPEPVARAYRALSLAADRIGRAGWDAALASHRGRGLPRYVPSPAHRDVVAAMPAVLSDAMTPDAAMALLWRYDVMRERLAAPREG